MLVTRIVIYLLLGTLFTPITPINAEKNHCPSKCHCSNDFTAVKCRGFDKFPVLEFAADVRTLDLSRGFITDIEKEDLKAYENLRLLDIRYNELKSISPGLFSEMKALRELYVANNPWSCDKSTLHVLLTELTALTDKNSYLENFDGGKMECFDPPDMKEKKPLHLIHPMVQVSHVHKVMKGRITDQHQIPGGLIALSIFLVVLMSAAACGTIWVFREDLLHCIRNVWRRKTTSDPVNKMEAGEMDNKDILIDAMKKRRRMSQGLPSSAASSTASLANKAVVDAANKMEPRAQVDNKGKVMNDPSNKTETPGQLNNKSILIDSMKTRRRMSQGLPASGTSSLSNSDDETEVDQTDYLKERMMKQRRQSRGFAEGENSCSEDEEGSTPR